MFHSERSDLDPLTEDHGREQEQAAQRQAQAQLEAQLEVPPKIHEQSSSSTSPSVTALPPINSSTNSSTNDKPPHPDEPPSLEYNFWTRKRIIFTVCFWTLVIVDSVFMPIALYFGLWYGTNLSPNTVFSIVTAAIGGISIVEYFLRFWRLFKKGSACRVIGGKRAYLDWFHWVFSGMWIVVMVELIIGSTPENPPIRLVAMPPTSLLYVFGLEMTVFEIMRWWKIPSPVRISSQPKGTTLRPGVYSLIEDIVAVDGNGGTAYRERLDRRYRASHIFRVMLERLTVFWALGAVGMAVVTNVLIFTLEGDYAYAVGWSAPFLWAGLWAAATYWYSLRMLKIEKATWADQNKP